MRGVYPMLAAAALAFGAYTLAPPIGEGLSFIPTRKRGKGQNNRRGKGKCKPPKSKPNRLTISKRVRRKHRRAA